MMNKDIIELNIESLNSEECTYSIPVYQRNYAWGEKEITQLIQDIVDGLVQNKENYFLGTLVVKQLMGNKD